MGGRFTQDVDEGLLGILPPVERPQKYRALDFDADRIGPGRLARQQILKLTSLNSCANLGAQSRWLAALSGQAATFCFSPVTISASSDACGFNRPVIC